MNIALIICIIGLIIYFACEGASGTKAAWAAEVGRLSFFAGLLAYLLK